MTAPILAVSAPLSRSTRRPASPRLAVFLALAPLAVAAPVAPALAGPVLCTTTLEAPSPVSFGTGPVEVTRCGVTRSVPELMEQRYYSYSAPYASGVNLLHQVTDVLGLSIPGRDGGRVVAFGFPDQNIVWDGSAIENTYEVILSDQHTLMPLRTSDITNGYGGSLGAAAAARPPATTWTPPIRGLW
ncbi:Occludin/ELL family protein [Synechococcus sp. CCY 9618]|uniref:Occludin/ELL family protein n=1 Tax=Synechococcus sp. CCY 9618 TaxID=2815602 RepID=UPI001C238F9F|nr:Occludin/ELL family protein [Synechococcus sp. CCY 9618]